VSRYGLIMYSSSSDVNGPIAFCTEDIYNIFNTIQGEDENDSNCIDFTNLSHYRQKSRVLDNSFSCSTDLKGVTVGILKEFLVDELD
jgi:Asp-tRNA(Asn)/Glu-tRNA(Gln) amidotransferase A subunit family amidase